MLGLLDAGKTVLLRVQNITWVGTYLDLGVA